MKKVFSFLALFILAGVVWYLFIKKADYIYKFKGKASTGSIFYSISNWQKTNEDIRTSTIDSTLYSSVVQQLTFNDKNYVLYWDINAINDSVSQVNVGIKQPENSIYNRVTAPFINTDFTAEAKTFLTDFKKMLDLNISTFKVHLEGKSVSPAKKCVCINAETSPEDKAKQMIYNYNYLNSYIVENNIQPDGFPMVIINEYNKKANSIDMDFCFPVKSIQKLPGFPQDIFLKEVSSKPALKAVFNGNYMYTQNAWFSLFDYADNHAVHLSDEVIEVFNNNPNMGGDALKWKTDIYIPVQ